MAPSLYGSLQPADRYAIARLIGRLLHANKTDSKSTMLIGPGRWGTTTPSLGVPVSFAEINTASVICEIAAMHEGLVPDVSLGTHFFNDLVEFDMLYMALYPGRKGCHADERLLLKSPNRLTAILPDSSRWAPLLIVIDTENEKGRPVVILTVDSVNPKAVCYRE